MICLILRILGMSGLSFTTKNYITWKIQKLEMLVLIVDGKFSFVVHLLFKLDIRNIQKFPLIVKVTSLVKAGMI